MPAKSKTSPIDQYLSKLTGDTRAALEKLRKAIKSAAPDAEECISYAMRSFHSDAVSISRFSRRISAAHGNRAGEPAALSQPRLIAWRPQPLTWTASRQALAPLVIRSLARVLVPGHGPTAGF
jgi:hypothetical protein